MTWTRLSDTFMEELAMLGLSAQAQILHINAIVWCNRMLTDGQISPRAVWRLTDGNSDELTMELLRAGVWWQSTDDDRFLQLDWSDQEEAKDIKARRTERKAIQKRYRE